jgi:hypothetical protein
MRHKSPESRIHENVHVRSGERLPGKGVIYRDLTRQPTLPGTNGGVGRLRLDAPAWFSWPLTGHFSGCPLAVAVFLASVRAFFLASAHPAL